MRAPLAAIRTTIFHRIPPEHLHVQLQEAHHWLTGDTSDVFPLVMKRYGYLRQFAPSLLDHLAVDLEPTASPALIEGLMILRDLHTMRCRPSYQPCPSPAFRNPSAPSSVTAAPAIAGPTNVPC